MGQQYIAGQGLKRKFFRRILIAIVVLVVIAVVSIGLIYRQYTEALKPVSSDQTEITVTIEQGSGLNDIAKVLKDKGLIRKASAFEWYIRLENVGDLQAGTYKLKPSMAVAEIVGILETGSVATDLVTILPGKTLDEIKAKLVKDGFNEAEVTAALNPAAYAGHPALADSPGITSLEGYLYPETFQRTAETTPSQVISASLDEMNKIFTPQIRAGIRAQGLSVHEGVILASIVENEVSQAEDRPKVAQVFLKRLKIGMRLESNATDDYPDSYNTYQIVGLPPAPLTNVSGSSLDAVAHPATTDSLYFVTGADCVTRFSSTLPEHERLAQEHGLSTESGQCN